MSGRFLRAIIAFLALPGIVAFVVPLLLLAPGDQTLRANAFALVPLSVGVWLLLWCVREFYTIGRGTLAPWSPPEALVETGPYRFCRNPMYVAVLLVLCGWAMWFRNWSLVAYTLAVMIAFHLRVLLYEEPRLKRAFGQRWLDYKVSVPRWCRLWGRAAG